MKNGRIALGIFLLTVGVIWVLINFGVIEWSAFNSLFVLWPLVLVAAGISVFVRNKPVIKALVWLVLIAVVLSYGYFFPEVRTPGWDTVDQHIGIENEAGLKYADLNLSLGAVQLDMGSGTNQLLEADTNQPNTEYSKNLSADKEKAVIRYKTSNDFHFGINTTKYEHSLRLNRDAIWDMDVKMGAVNGTFDLRSLKVRDMELGVGASSLRMMLGSEYESSRIKISAGASKLDLVLPQDAGVRIHTTGLLSGEDLDKLGWDKKENTYTSPGYNNAARKIDLDITMGAGKLSVTMDQGAKV